MNIIIFGPPGAGKGTQAKLLAQEKNMTVISTGEILREEIKQASEIGLKVKAILENTGALVPDELMIELLQKRLETTDGLILDGFPRTVPQALALDSILKIDLVLNLLINEKEAKQRINGRFHCKVCGEVYHKYNKPVKIGLDNKVVCEKCFSTEFDTRKDDVPEIINERVKVYRKQTKPILKLYRDRGILVDINGAANIEEVHKLILQEVSSSAYEKHEEKRKKDIVERLGFDATEDAACMIARFFEAMINRYSKDRLHPLIGHAVKMANDRYLEGRAYDFTVAKHIAMTEAIRTILKSVDEK